MGLTNVEIWGLVYPGGIIETCPGLAGCTHGSHARVLCMVGVIGNVNIPHVPCPSSECMEAVFEISLI